MPENDNVTMGPYEALSEYADRLWQVYQNNLKTNKKLAKKALNLYDIIEDEYLDPARKKKIRENTENYRKLSKELQSSTNKLKKAIKEIDAIIKKGEKFAILLGYFETAIKIGAKLVA